MTTRFKNSLVAGVAVLTMATAAPMLMAEQDQPQRRQGPGVSAQGRGPGGPGMRRGGPGGPMGLGPGFRQLNLTDDQKAQLKQIAESHRDEFKAAGDKVRTAREGLRSLLEADAIDENAIRAKNQEIAAAEADVMILNARVRKESLQVLTSEQQAKLKEIRAKRERPRQRRGQH